MIIVHVCCKSIISDGDSYQENLLAKWQKRNGHKVFIITNKFYYDKNGKIQKTEATNYFNTDGVFIIRLESFLANSVNSPFFVLRNVKNNLKNINPDIIFLHGCQTINVLDILHFVKSKKQIKLFVDNHADFSNSARNVFSKIILHGVLWRYMAKILIPFTSRFYGVLPTRVDFLREVYKIPKDKCELLPMGADDEALQYVNAKKTDKIKRELNLPNKSIVLVTGGKIDKFKTEVLNLMRAIKDSDRIDIILLIFGSVVEELEEEFNCLLLENKIIFLGWKNRNQIYEILKISDIAIFPGRHSVLWEQAVALGCPLVIKDRSMVHIDFGGNIKYINFGDRNEFIGLLNSINRIEIQHMKNIANSQRRKDLLYSNISKTSIE